LKCDYCGKEEALPFKCQFCRGLFCTEHRLPENHACTQIEKAKAPREAPPFEYKVTYTPPRPLAKFWFSPTEIKHLTMSAFLVFGVGFGMLAFKFQLIVVLVASFIFVWFFLLHEIAHKLVAQHYGLWAEFRLILFGALITLLSIISPFKFISPGAVMIAGNADRKSVGKTAVAGPLVNIVFSLVSLALTFVPPGPFLGVAVFSAAINAFIAIINLIPAGVLDGLKVFHWNKPVWGMVLIVSMVLLILVFVLYGEWLLL